MKKQLLFPALLIAMIQMGAAAQGKFFPSQADIDKMRAAQPAPPSLTFTLPEGWTPREGSPVNTVYDPFQSLTAGPLPLLPGRQGPVAVRLDPTSGLPIMVRGALQHPALKFPGKSELENRLFSYLEVLKTSMHIQRPSEEFAVRSVSEDELGYTHVRLQQVWRGVEVFGGELALHLKGGEVRFFNGRYFPSPGIDNLKPKIEEAAAIRIALEELARQTTVRSLRPAERQLLGGPPHAARLVVYHSGEASKGGRLAWALTLTPNLGSRWAYFVDARSGAVLKKYSLLCRLHHYHPADEHREHACPDLPPPMRTGKKMEMLPDDGPRTATADNLFGEPVTFQTYESGGEFYLIDASREMFSTSQSNLPGQPVGAIWTIDARNTNPRNDNFTTFQIISPDNTWDNPVAVSAHYNAGRAYEYFKNTFGRNSINGQGGNIISIINVTDEGGLSMDDAFWLGIAMFYGNGDRLFSSPLAKGLDVAGHEISHGVIQNTAGLEYQGESGAINESFADVFGVLIDRDDWTIGEEVVSTDFYPTGAMRDLSNPNNGGRREGNRGWQPANTSDQFFGPEDNGGVHINSGIPNLAFFLFASEVGLDVAEQIYYRALTRYLLRSSQFVDLRIAVIQAAADLHPQDDQIRQAAASAFDAVGIVGEQGGDYQQDVEINTGEDFIVYTGPDQQDLYIVTPEGELIADPLYEGGVISRPSLTDDGSVVLFVGADRNIHFILIDWTVPTVVNSGTLFEGLEWRNVAISRDGNRLAAITGSFDNPASLDNKIYVVDLTTNPLSSEVYTLYNPTTAQGGIRTEDVLFADRLEWDFSGAYLLYDAFNSIPSGFGNNLDYWDIGFLRAWDNASQSFGDGNILKLFSGLASGVTIGNPAFAKNSPYILAFDFTENEESFNVFGMNIETQELGLIFEGSPVYGVPSYSTDDRSVIFNARTNTGRPVLAIRSLTADKIAGEGNVDILLPDAFNGVWFATGQRNLNTSRPVLIDGMPVEVFPNPFGDGFQVAFNLRHPQPIRLELFDLMGRRHYIDRLEGHAGKVRCQIEGDQLMPGIYLLRISAGSNSVSYRVVKR